MWVWQESIQRNGVVPATHVPKWPRASREVCRGGELVMSKFAAMAANRGPTPIVARPNSQRVLSVVPPCQPCVCVASAAHPPPEGSAHGAVKVRPVVQNRR